jgi:hypothetical protein
MRSRNALPVASQRLLKLRKKKTVLTARLLLFSSSSRFIFVDSVVEVGS